METAPTDRDAVRARIAAELGEILDVDHLVLDDAAQAADVPGWDSLTQLKLLVALEPAFGLKFQLDELNAPKNVGELVDLVLAKRGS